MSEITKPVILDETGQAIVTELEKIYNALADDIEYTIVEWSTGTDEEIENMLKAHYAGKIDVRNYWTVGDRRTVSLSAIPATEYINEQPAQTVDFVLAKSGGKKLSDNVTDCAFIVGVADYLSGYGTMAETHKYLGGWDASIMRTWCNTQFRNAIPITLRGIFREHVNRTADNNGDTYKDSVDYFALPAEKEVTGENTYASSTAESSLSQFKYYETTANRIKSDNTVSNWWTRSYYKTDANQHSGIYISDEGEPLVGGPTTPRLIVPFGVI